MSNLAPDGIRQKVIQVYAEESMNANKAAEKLYMHRNTVAYHLDMVKKETGLDPRNFYDLVELLGFQMEG